MDNTTTTQGALALRLYLQGCGIPASEFADNHSIKIRSLHQWKAGTVTPSVAAAVKLEKATGGFVKVHMWAGEAVRRG